MSYLYQITLIAILNEEKEIKEIKENSLYKKQKNFQKKNKKNLMKSKSINNKK
jgi:hypothetical protein